MPPRHQLTYYQYVNAYDRGNQGHGSTIAYHDSMRQVMTFKRCKGLLVIASFLRVLDIVWCTNSINLLAVNLGL